MSNPVYFTSNSSYTAFKFNSSNVTVNGSLSNLGNVSLSGYSASLASFQPQVTNSASLGTSTNLWSAIWSTNGTIQTSDSSVKDHAPLSYGLADLLKVSTINFKWKDNYLRSNDPAQNDRYFGVIAEELNEIFPELVYNDVRPFQINYSELIPVCINAIKELHAAIVALSDRISNVEAR